ncbi:MAG: Short-chain dehydrogenase/reductase [Betaproteobacteria bacterium]|nr:Short-chain dehydrogenase/reductase [Betaproteobacteria bacterium]
MATTSSSPARHALIIGASRGLGLALAAEYLRRGWNVTGTVRGDKRGALHALSDQNTGRLDVEAVDITDEAQIAALSGRLAGRRYDLLLVNAGIANSAEKTIAQVSTEDFVQLMLTNALAPMRVMTSLESLVPASGTLAVMSSGLGSIANTSGAWHAYSASKAALNMLMKGFAAQQAGDPRAMVVIAPGWVRTDMGGPGASLSVEESIPRVVDMLESRSGRPGIAYRDYTGATVPW